MCCSVDPTWNVFVASILFLFLSLTTSHFLPLSMKVKLKNLINHPVQQVNRTSSQLSFSCKIINIFTFRALGTKMNPLIILNPFIENAYFNLNMNTICLYIKQKICKIKSERKYIHKIWREGLYTSNFKARLIVKHAYIASWA